MTVARGDGKLSERPNILSIRHHGSARACNPELRKLMTTWLPERAIKCPYCAETMNIVLDLSAGGQTYVEDCQICCQPMQIGFDVSDAELLNLRVERGG